METLWFVLVTVMLTVYVLLDGFDLGVGAILPWVAKSESQRRVALEAVGPVWDGNEVWLLAAGGTLFFAFPMLYASSFSGFYLPLIIVVWLLMLRGLSIELRSHVNNPLWRDFWDALFFLGSGLLAVFFGAALGNVTRGVALGADGYFFEPLWTNFNPAAAQPGILDWYTVIIGVLALAALVLHGAAFLAIKTDNTVRQRSLRTVSAVWWAVVVLTAVATAATFLLRPALFDNYLQHPWGFVFPALAVAGLLGLRFTRLVAAGMAAAHQDRLVFAASSAYIAGMLTSNAFAAYPNLLTAVDAGRSLTIYNAAASAYGLSVGLVWWSIGMALAILYFAVVYRMFRGKVHVAPG